MFKVCGSRTAESLYCTTRNSGAWGRSRDQNGRDVRSAHKPQLFTYREKLSVIFLCKQ